MEKNRYNSLDGVRSIMCIAIVAMHVLANISVKPSFNIIVNVISYFGNFTLLFMIVSAFGMCCGYYDKFKSNKISLNDFYKKRYIRILPFYAILLLIAFVLEPNLCNLYELFTCLTLSQSLLPNHNISIVGVGWFLSVVFVFYMFFPFYIFLLDNKKRAWLVLGVVIILNFLCVYYYSSSKLVLKDIGRLNFIFDLPYFVVGGILYLYRYNIRSLEKYKRIWGVCTICITVLFFCIETHHYYIHFFLELFFFISIMIYAIMESGKSLLNNKLMHFLSNISLEIYLCHMMCFRLVEKLHIDIIFNNDICYFLSLFLTLCLAIGLASFFKRFENLFFYSKSKLCI